MSNDNNSKRATEDLMDEIHGHQARQMLDTLRAYQSGEYKDEDGNPKPIPPSVLAAVSKFLKDNGVDRPVRPGNQVDKLAKELDEFEKDIDNVVDFPR